ncbi:MULTISPECIES: polyprenyl diphosphate synthase [Streptomyces]|uniref:polyprenyl diphosphate synthase n=1 Tax=Streptomyces TaxID=1883 RepID=UPI001CCD8993|nr:MULTISPECIES: polyprenyl diphosphate synthase [Streptomyces]UBI41300.1 di-trans,poly-cis-decaprenylcistransferase [Streptomyces mobaraensis]
MPPRHVAVILDGNRRWAAEHRLPLFAAYRAGAVRVHELAGWCEQAGITFVTVWALSRDNLRRAPAVVRQITGAVTAGLQTMASTRRWRIRIIGAMDELRPEDARTLREITEQTRHIQGITLNVAVAYSGRDDIVSAVRSLIRSDGAGGGAVTEDRLARHLSTAGQPDVDLVIRTSGEQRLSGFMVWQVAEAELYFTDTAWPDFDHHSFDAALRWYHGRHRRFGR